MLVEFVKRAKIKNVKMLGFLKKTFKKQPSIDYNRKEATAPSNVADGGQDDDQGKGRIRNQVIKSVVRSCPSQRTLKFLPSGCLCQKLQICLVTPEVTQLLSTA